MFDEDNQVVISSTGEVIEISDIYAVAKARQNESNWIRNPMVTEEKDLTADHRKTITSYARCRDK